LNLVQDTGYRECGFSWYFFQASAGVVPRSYHCLFLPNLFQFISHGIIEGIWERGGIAPPFLTSALDGGEWDIFTPGLFTPGERAPILIV
jgi:hypothetical protein